MTRASILVIVGVTAVALSATVGSAYYLHAHGKRKPWPKATPPPPPSPIYVPSQERAATAEEIEAGFAVHNRRLALEIERALATRDRMRRETAFTFLLPELIQVDPQLAVDLVASQKPGEARDTVRTELARQWISKDRDAAIGWMKSLEDPGERRASAYAAVQAIAAAAPGQAIYVADQFDIGRDDGYLENLVEAWSADSPHEVTRWLADQPEGPRKQQLAARAERVRRESGAP